MSDRWQRTLLISAAVCWSIIAVANIEIDDRVRVQPDAIGAMSIASAVLTAIVAIRPQTVSAYRFGGTVAIGTLTLRFFSFVAGLSAAGVADLFWIAAAQAGVSLMLALTYGRWWLTDVKAWHRAHRWIDTS